MFPVSTYLYKKVLRTLLTILRYACPKICTNSLKKIENISNKALIVIFIIPYIIRNLTIHENLKNPKLIGKCG